MYMSMILYMNILKSLNTALLSKLLKRSAMPMISYITLTFYISTIPL